jgi:hypothetical protein
MKKLSVPQHETHVTLKEVAAPSSPSAGYVALYSKTDKKLYIKDSSGAETALVQPKVLQATVFDYTTDLATGDGKFYFVIPSAYNGMNLTRVHARVITAGTTGTTDIQIANVTDSVDMLSTKLTIDSAQTGSDTAATAAVIDTTKDDVATNDLLRIDIDAASTTKPKGLIVTLEFQLP